MPSTLHFAALRGTKVPDVAPIVECIPSACRVNPLSAEGGQKAPTLLINVAGTSVPALLDTGASVSLLGKVALTIAQQRRITIRPVNSQLKLACGNTKVYGTLRLRLRWKGGSCRQRFLVVPELNLPAILGRDFLSKQDISIHLKNGGWTLGPSPQHIIPFDQTVERNEPVQSALICQQF